MKGTMDTEQAKVDGAKVTTQDKTVLDQILEKVSMEQVENDAQFRIIDIELSSEIVGTMRGHFAKNLIYNIPRRSPKGRTSHRECDRMPNGCSYKGQPHIHIIGVGYQGALTALRAYGKMSATVKDMPEMVEQGAKNYWAAYGEATDRHTGNELGRWYMEPVLRKAGGKFIENEFGMSIAQSKALRNVILALIPAKLMEGWIEDYKDGKQAFNVQRAKEMGYGPQPEEKKDQKKRKEKSQRTGNVQSPGEQDLTATIKRLAEQLSVDGSDLEKFYAEQGWTPGQAMLRFNNALNEEADLNKVSLALDKWREDKKAEGSVDSEVEMEPTDGRADLNGV